MAVDYATADLTATQRADYTIASGTLRFAAGGTSKTFTVLVTDDVYLEGDETLALTLGNQTGGATLGGQSTATLTIQDDDTSQPSTNSIDGAQPFVRQHYSDFLSREPDTGGWD